MRKHVLLFVTLFALSNLAHAGGLRLGVKIGAQHVDEKVFKVPATMVSGQLSYEVLDLVAASVAAEVELSKSVTDSRLGNLNTGVKASFQNVGAYLSARTLGPLYAIGRIGIARNEVKFSTGKSNKSNGLSMGLGAGFSLGASTELELTSYTIKNEDNSDKTSNAYYLSLGFGF